MNGQNNEVHYMTLMLLSEVCKKTECSDRQNRIVDYSK